MRREQQMLNYQHVIVRCQALNQIRSSGAALRALAGIIRDQQVPEPAYLKASAHVDTAAAANLVRGCLSLWRHAASRRTTSTAPRL